MTLSSHLLNQHFAAMQTPNNNSNNNNSFTPYTPMVGNDGSQFGGHHGMSPWGMTQSYMPPPPTPGRFTEWSEVKVATLQARLQRKLGPEYITQRPGPGGGPKLSYVEGWKVVNLANEVFGFNGWSSSIVKLQTDFLDVTGQDRCSVGITSIIRITLQDGCFHEDIGYGHAENVRGKAAALEKAQKEAVTDGIKRALKGFGNVLGNCLYDKDYTKQVQKIKVPAAKFNVEDLERRPEFTPEGAPARVASAVPRNVSGDMKPPPPPQPAIAGPPRPEPVSSGPEDTPLRSVDEFDDLDMDDSEFAFMESESFMGHFDESVLSTRVTSDVPMLGQAPPPPAPQPAAAHSVSYTHRQRPDPAPRADQPPQAPGQENIPANTTSACESRNTGSTSVLPPQTAESAAAARRKAILAELGGGASAPTSPRLPSGGVQGVAIRATANLVTHGSNLDIDNTASDQYAGFSSARGVKRNGSTSPSKSRPGVRSALSELPIPDPDDLQQKRSRIM